MKQRVFLITPVLNEVENLPNLTQSWKNLSIELSEFEFHFILVDDGSNDNTGIVAQELSKDLNFILLSHTKNKGPGYAFGTGFEYLAPIITKNDMVVTIEGDNTSRMETLSIMLGRIIRENVDVTFASPYAYGGGFHNTSFIRVLISHFGTAITKTFLGIHGIQTFSSFFRAYKGEVIITLQKRYGARILEFDGFECMIELLQKLIIMQFSISEVAMKLDTSLRKGKSKMKVVKTALSYFSVYNTSKKWRNKNT